ncbi:hypothetical protein LAZ67_13002790 [Cordylochernes scorpioides]|uniref:Mos1 transposase HTH domain-containing protein n=1 Tax=Cordylochernes scorpioides TaxID=51811 RepID=A0ABY6L9I3_9ARAC|nr:hypothetical protein LAZ67_13002790 [Cordylochernes scorpioides]
MVSAFHTHSRGENGGARKNICEVEGKRIVNRRTDSKWFKRFREGDISLEDKPRMGRPHVTDIETLRFLVMDNPLKSTREMSARLRFREGDISLEEKPRMGLPHVMDIETLRFLVMDNPINLRVKYICEVEGKRIVNRRTDSKWFKRFREGDISLEDKPRMGRPHVMGIETLRYLVMDNPQKSTCEMSARLGPSQDTINRTLHKLHFVSKRSKQDPHDLTIAQSQRRVEFYICEVEGKRIVNRRTDSKWFKRFREGDISLEDKPRMGRPHVMGIETLRYLVMDNPQKSTCEMSARLGPSQDTINRSLHKLHFVSKRSKQDPHDLTIAQSQRRVEFCK